MWMILLINIFVFQPVSEVWCMAGPQLPSPMEAEPLGHGREQDEELLTGS